jgi:hypothetical protein
VGENIQACVKKISIVRRRKKNPGESSCRDRKAGDFPFFSFLFVLQKMADILNEDF